MKAVANQLRMCNFLSLCVYGLKKIITGKQLSFKRMFVSLPP